MAAVAFTKVAANPFSLVYTWTGDAAGTLLGATLATDAALGSPLRSKLAALLGECDTDAKAQAALLGGQAFVGAVTANVESHIRSRIVHQTGATAAPLLTAADSGAGNNPDLTLTVAAAGTGYLIVELIPSEDV